MRGKVSFGVVEDILDRITPAYAGKSRPSRATIDVLRGSPPPMRGKVPAPVAEGVEHGITPAYAGKSYWATVSQRQTEDHPRLCGEKATRRRRKVKKIGSPPPMRGKVCEHVVTSYSRRITPAYAGKRSASRGHVEAVKDHPRLCGEKFQKV